MTDIVPAILTDSFETLTDELAFVAGRAPVVQVDVCDGMYVPKKTWPFLPRDRAQFTEYVQGEQGLPHWEELDYEIDLMVQDPERHIPDWVATGASRVVVHFGSTHDIAACRAAAGDTVELGLALKVSDDPESAAGEIALSDYIQVMGIEHPGVQGAVFTERAVALVATLRREYPDMLIQVDGGVSIENAQDLLDAGATRLVVGSAIFTDSDAAGALRELQSI